MEGIEVAGLYLVMAAAIVGGLLLLWLMLGELIHFDGHTHPARSAKIPEARVADAVRSPSRLLELRPAAASRPARGSPGARLIRGAAH